MNYKVSVVASMAVMLALVVSAHATSEMASEETEARFCRVRSASAALAASVEGGGKGSAKGIALLLSSSTAKRSWPIYARLANFRKDLVAGYGREFTIERRMSDGWDLDPASPKGPWPAVLGRIDPGEVGRCYVFRVPPEQPAGEYRFSTSVYLRLGDRRLVKRRASFTIPDPR